MNNPLDKLAEIQKVEAPAFLLTRIQQKINSENTTATGFSPRLVWAFSLSFALVLLLNAAVLIKNTQEPIAEKVLTETLNLLPNNTLYHE